MFNHDFINPNIRFTEDGGIAVKLINNTGEPSIKGMLVKNSTELPMGVELTDISGPGLYAPIGVFLHDGIPDGEMCWIVTSCIGYVYIVEGLGVELGAGLRTSATAPGTAHQFTPAPDDAEHFREIGHTLEAKSADDPNRLVKALLHFN